MSGLAFVLCVIGAGVAAEQIVRLVTWVQRPRGKNQQKRRSGYEAVRELI